MTSPNPSLLQRAINKVLARRVLTVEEKRYEIIVRMISDLAYSVLIDAGRRFESDWDDRTRFTLLGYLTGSAIESLDRGTTAEHETTTALAYQRLSSLLVVRSGLVARRARLEASKDKYTWQASKLLGTTMERCDTEILSTRSSMPCGFAGCAT